MLNSTAVITNETAPLLNDTCEDGLLLAGPLRTHRNALIYMAALLWTFLGVAIAADAFMLGIETITSQEQAKTVVVDGRKRVYSLKIWNATVANLTLMALGSSAPEILLSLIEIVSSGFYSGELGPSTIVGSAAFNLFIIAAVCVVAVAAPKKVADTGVFSITAAASVFAYVWLAYILLVSSPNVIEVWEGAATLAFFPLLVWLAYLADVGAFSCPDKARPATHVVVAFTRDGKPIRRGDLARELQRMDPDAADGTSDAQGLASYLASSLGTLRSEKHA